MVRSVTALFAAAFLILGAACSSATAPAQPAHPAVYYVSLSGNGTNGLSWATAWRNTSVIDWPVIQPGSQIILDGGTSRCHVSPYEFSPSSPDPGVTCGQRYRPFSVGQDDIIIERSTAAGHDGTVVIDGGRNTPLPWCGQPSYSAAASKAIAGINMNGHSGVVIDGMARSGIVVRGAKNGVMMGPGHNNTLRNMEIFDNGYVLPHSWGYSTSGEGILMGGENNVYDRMLIHDNGDDEFHSDSDGYDESGSAVYDSWMGTLRANARYAFEPFNDLQASGQDPGCTHADGMQIFEPGTTMSGLTFNYDVFGPGTNTGLFPSDAGTGTTFNDVTIKNSLFLSPTGWGIITVNPVHGWNLSHDTLIASRGALEIPGNGANTMTDVVKYGGYVSTTGGSWTTSGNVWYGGQPLPGAADPVEPRFSSVPLGPLPSSSSVPTGPLPSLASLRAANVTPSGTTSGSPLHSLSALLARIDALNGSQEK